MRTFFISIFLVASFITASRAATLFVGAGRTYATPSAACAAAHDGDTVLIDGSGGGYTDCGTWPQNNLAIIGINGKAHVQNMACSGKAIWNIDGTNTLIDNIEFSGAHVADQNGAGIRMEGTNLIVRHCYFHDNDEGILAGDNANSTITVEYSEFAYNGFGDGYSHNMYINHIKQFVLRGCYVHGAKIGHNVKSRAFNSIIAYNRIMDEAVPTKDSTSRDIDLPNGGMALVIGNLIEEGPDAQNSNLLEFGLEGLTNPGKSLFVINNTFVNDRPNGCTFVELQQGTDTLEMINNIFAGKGTVLSGGAMFIDSSNNLISSFITSTGLKNPDAYDYHLIAESPACNAGAALDSVAGFNLLAAEEYFHPDSTTPRKIYDAIDIGAYEFPVSINVAQSEKNIPDVSLTIFPNPAARSATISLHAIPGNAKLEIINALGETILRATSQNKNVWTYDCSGLPAGLYVARLTTSSQIFTKTLMIVK